ncbi:MAG: beta-N-acetylhexosaminidase [Pleurocapsa minor GSE-CHR-MK-17-07R]|jgi:beta-N-acetylhexosaminidase|nr:beta-N-acetylhexosaminidase [Pleurocapsa minor GSE-CHR-MK 17-07R]
MPFPTPTTLESRVGQLFFAGFEGLEAPDYILDWLRAGRLGGIILFSRNVSTPQQLAALTDSLQAAAPYGVVISIDQEGGTVARLREGFTESPGAMALASARDGEALIERVSHMLATELRALGIHWNYAPVVDIAYNPDNPSMGTRALGNNAESVSRLSAAAVRGFQSGGVASSPKHFPGMGHTPIDTHLALPELDTPLEHLVNVDLLPYRACIAAGAASVMVTHVLYRALDADYPCTLSPVVVSRLLRGELGYDGVVTTDCLEMQAITDHYGPAETAILAALAGIDAILFSHTRARQEAAYDAVLEAVKSGRIPMQVIDDANRRLAAFKARYVLPRKDLGAIRAPEHLALAEAAARAGTTLARAGEALPLGGRVGVIEFSSALESGIGEVDGLAGFRRLLRERLPDAEVIVLKGTDFQPDKAIALAGRVDTLVLAVRSAHLSPEKTELSRRLLAAAHRAVLVCLRNPYDAMLLGGADSVLCTCGDSVPSLAAAVAALMGDFVPTGSLPVEVQPA